MRLILVFKEIIVNILQLILATIRVTSNEACSGVGEVIIFSDLSGETKKALNVHIKSRLSHNKKAVGKLKVRWF